MEIVIHRKGGCKVKSISVLILSFFLVCSLASAEMKTWTGSEDNSWHNPNNWDPPGVPGPGDDVGIPSGSNCEINEGDANCNNIMNDGNLSINGGNLNSNGDFVNNGRTEVENGNANVGGNMENNSDFNSNNSNVDVGGEVENNSRMNLNNSDMHSDRMRNNGDMDMSGGKFETDTHFDNYGDMDMSGGEIEAGGNINNSGNMNISNGDATADGNFTNNDSLNLDNARAEAGGDFNNTSDGNIEMSGRSNIGGVNDVNNEGNIGGVGNSDVRIYGRNVNNSGRISGSPVGGNVAITALITVENNSGGQIIGGYNELAGGAGGDVIIIANNIRIHQGSDILGGAGQAKGGNVKLIGKCQSVIEGGQTKGGRYTSKGVGGSVYIYSDSVYFSFTDTLDSVYSDYCFIKGNSIVFDTLNHGWSFYQARFVVATTYGGFADFSNLNTTWSIFSSYSDSEYVIFSNDRRLPDSSLQVFAFGITPEDTSDADTTILKEAYMYQNEAYIHDTTGVTDSIHFFLRNLCLGAYKLHYRIFSDLSWVTSYEDSVILPPFTDEDSFWVRYTIPTLPEDTIIADTVRQVVWIFDSATATAETVYENYSLIYGSLNTSLEVREIKISQKPKKMKIFAHPNPFNSSVEISVAEAAKPVDVEIFDISGKLIHTEKSVVRSFVWKPDKSIPGGIFLISTTKNNCEPQKILYIK